VFYSYLTIDRQRNLTMTFGEIRELLAQTALAQREASDRLTRTKKIVESNARAIEANASAIADMRRSQEADRAAFRASVEDMVETITQSVVRIEEHAAFIRGLQVENRRSWERLENRPSDSDDN
jgi:hypothetical protein